MDKLIGWDSSRCPSVRPSPLSNMNIYETSLSIVIIGVGIGCIRFSTSRIRTLVYLAIDSSHRVIMGNIL